MTRPSYRRRNEVMFAAVGEDIVALDVANGHCFGMEQVTAAVWNLLAEPRDPDALCAALVEQYDVDPALCRSEVGRLLDQMVSENLVELLALAGP